MWEEQISSDSPSSNNMPGTPFGVTENRKFGIDNYFWLTGGRGIHSEEFSHYQEMPGQIEQKVIAESKKPVEAEK